MPCAPIAFHYRLPHRHCRSLSPTGRERLHLPSLPHDSGRNLNFTSAAMVTASQQQPQLITCDSIPNMIQNRCVNSKVRNWGLAKVISPNSGTPEKLRSQGRVRHGRCRAEGEPPVSCLFPAFTTTTEPVLFLQTTKFVREDQLKWSKGLILTRLHTEICQVKITESPD